MPQPRACLNPKCEIFWTLPQDAGKAWDLVDVVILEPRQTPTPETFSFRLNRQKLHQARRGEGTYLLRTNLATGNPEDLWKQYIVLTEVERKRPAGDRLL